MPDSGSSAADWISAGATFFAVIVALFAQRIVKWWDGKPELELVIPDDSQKGDFTFILVNNEGSAVSELTEVFIKSIKRKNDRGKYENIQEFVPMSLRWMHHQPDHPEIFVTILPGMMRYCIVGKLKIVDGSVLFELWTESKQSYNANILAPGAYIADIVISSKQSTPKYRCMILKVPDEFIVSQLLISIGNCEGCD
ncbi:MAG: hypothetical protein U1E35_06875 [Rhodospirillales bacterium]